MKVSPNREAMEPHVQRAVDGVSKRAARVPF